MMLADFDSTVFARLGEKESKKRSAAHFPKRYRKWALSSANLKTALLNMSASCLQLPWAGPVQ